MIPESRWLGPRGENHRDTVRVLRRTRSVAMAVTGATVLGAAGAFAMGSALMLVPVTLLGLVALGFWGGTLVYRRIAQDSWRALHE